MDLTQASSTPSTNLNSSVLASPAARSSIARLLEDKAALKEWNSKIEEIRQKESGDAKQRS